MAHSGVFIGVSVLNLIWVLALFFYFPGVYLNLTFTHTNLTEVPYYSDSISLATTNRYHWEWWVYASDVLRILPPIIFLFFYCNLILHKNAGVLWYTVSMVILLLIDTAKMLKLFWHWGFCASYQFCRAYSARNDGTGEDPAVPNYNFHMIMWFNVGFFILTLIYTFLGGPMRKQTKPRSQER